MWDKVWNRLTGARVTRALLHFTINKFSSRTIGTLFCHSAVCLRVVCITVAAALETERQISWWVGDKTIHIVFVCWCEAYVI